MLCWVSLMIVLWVVSFGLLCCECLFSLGLLRGVVLCCVVVMFGSFVMVYCVI